MISIFPKSTQLTTINQNVATAMKLCIYKALKIVRKFLRISLMWLLIDSSVTVIKKDALLQCGHLLTIIMGRQREDNYWRACFPYVYSSCMYLLATTWPKCTLFGIIMLSHEFDSQRRWNTLDVQLYVIVVLYRLCSSHWQSNRLMLRHYGSFSYWDYWLYQLKYNFTMMKK